MRKPPRFWENMFARRGFGRQKDKKPAAVRKTRLMAFEALEPRRPVDSVLWEPGAKRRNQPWRKRHVGRRRRRLVRPVGRAGRCLDQWRHRGL